MAWAAAAIALPLVLILLILAVRVDIIIEKHKETGIKVYLKVLGVSIGREKEDRPGRKKKKPAVSRSEKKGGSIFNRIMKAIGLSRVESGGAIKKSLLHDGAGETVRETAESVMIILREVFSAVGHVRVNRLEIKSVSAGEDAGQAALRYGISCSVLYPLVGYVMSGGKVNRKKTTVDISCDFEAEKPQLDLDITLSLRVFYAVKAAVGIILENMKRKTEGEYAA